MNSSLAKRVSSWGAKSTERSRPPTISVAVTRSAAMCTCGKNLKVQPMASHTRAVPTSVLRATVGEIRNDESSMPAFVMAFVGQRERK